MNEKFEDKFQGQQVFQETHADRESTREEQNKITFSLTYYPAFQNVAKILPELHLSLAPDVAQSTNNWL